MAAELVMVVRSGVTSPASTRVDNIIGVLLNVDDGHTDAEIIAHAVAKCVAAHHPVPATYFDTVMPIADLSSGPLKDDLDGMVMMGLGESV